MRHIKKFENFDTNHNPILDNDNSETPKINSEEEFKHPAMDYIMSKYSKDDVIEMLDEEIAGGNWIDRDQMEDEGIDDEHEYYQEYGRGEAEDAIVSEIITDYQTANNDILSTDDYCSISDWIHEYYEVPNR